MYERYCTLRDKKGVTDYEVAKVTGLNRAVFSDWRRGKSTPKIDKLQKIAHYFGVSVSYLIGETEEKAAETPHDSILSTDIEELLKEARRATAADIKAATVYLKRFNDYADALRNAKGE